MKKELIYSLEDDDNISELIKYILEKESFECIICKNKSQLFEELGKRIPNLITLDIMLPDGDGLEILRSIKDNYSKYNIKVIMVSAKRAEINVVQGLNLGADDYVCKPFSVLEFIARVKANLRKTNTFNYNHDGCVTLGNIKIIKNKRIVFLGDVEVHLTQKEFLLFIFLVENINNVVDREALLENVWGLDKSIETRTIDMHVNSIREKLKLRKSLITVRSVGYKLVYP